MLEPPHSLPTGNSAGWIPLTRHQRAGDTGAGTFHPGWARIGWNENALIFDWAFAATHPRNSAVRLNQRTHALGDVGEIFVQHPASPRYVEVHVTPENQRLQLAWDDERVQAVRNHQAALEDFTVADPEWVQSITEVGRLHWAARALLPASILLPKNPRLAPATELIASVCRYDYTAGVIPVLSSTAHYAGRPFHHRAAWNRITLLP